MPSKQTLFGGGAAALLALLGTGGDPTVIADMLAKFSWQQLAVIGAALVAVHLIDSPATRAKIKGLTEAVERASVPPGKP